jgi:hypothetical protein
MRGTPRAVNIRLERHVTDEGVGVHLVGPGFRAPQPVINQPAQPLFAVGVSMYGVASPSAACASPTVWILSCHPTLTSGFFKLLCLQS